mmetsp:Transcript_60220/g.123710  ORF Transcript_60220/g.123710 Transcript_60220/m.123710 type:complete len:392 (+) Transcript_60220:622-1797(+)
MRPVGSTLALSPNGLTALDAICPDAYSRVVEKSVEPDVCVVKNMKDQVVKKTHFIQNKALLLVWHVLQMELAIELPPECIHLGRKFLKYQVDPETRKVTAVFRCVDGSEEIVRADCLIGADGVNSAVHQCMHGSAPQKVVHDKIMFRANLLKKDVETSFPSPHDIPDQGVQISWSKEDGELFSFRETGGDYLTYTAISNFGSDEGGQNVAQELWGEDQEDWGPELIKKRATLKRNAGGRKKVLKRMFEGYPASVQHIIDITQEDAIYVNEVMDHPVSERWVDGPVGMLGDAVHTMTPDAGQGANMSLEDAAELAAFLSIHRWEERGLEKGLVQWEAARKPRVKIVRALSREMTRTNSPVNTPGAAGQPKPAYFNFIYAYRSSLSSGCLEQN